MTCYRQQHIVSVAGTRKRGDREARCLQLGQVETKPCKQFSGMKGDRYQVRRSGEGELNNHVGEFTSFSKGGTFLLYPE